MNTTIGHIIDHPVAKKVVSGNQKIVSFFKRSHYWGGELQTLAQGKGITRGLVTHSDSRWYTLILQMQSVARHR